MKIQHAGHCEMVWSLAPAGNYKAKAGMPFVVNKSCHVELRRGHPNVAVS